MDKSTGTNSEATALWTFKYGMPVYGLAWPQEDTFYLCGGGGSTSSGIKNRVVGAQRVQGLLSDQVVEHDFGKNCPMRLAMTPNGKSMVVAMAQGALRRLDVDTRTKAKLTEASGDFAERLAADKSEVKCLAFNPRGDALILGGVDGTLKILSWPGLDVKLHLKGEERLADSIRDVVGAPGVRVPRCAVVLDNGTAQIWDWETGQAVCKVGLAKGEPLKSDLLMSMTGPSTAALQELPKGMQGARFASLRYAPLPATPPTPSGSAPCTPSASSAGSAERTVLYSLMNNRQGCWVVVWEQDSSTGMLSMVRYKRVGKEPSSCFDVSPCGKLLAVGTSQSVIMVLNASNLSLVCTRPKAHTVFCTGVCFSPDSQHVLSVSGDASATLTSTQKTTDTVTSIHRAIVGTMLLIAILMTLVLVAVRVLKATGHREAVERIGQVLKQLNVVKK